MPNMLTAALDDNYGDSVKAQERRKLEQKKKEEAQEKAAQQEVKNAKSEMAGHFNVDDIAADE